VCRDKFEATYRTKPIHPIHEGSGDDKARVEKAEGDGGANESLSAEKGGMQMEAIRGYACKTPAVDTVESIM
jgi:hypothetical protein